MDGDGVRDGVGEDVRVGDGELPRDGVADAGMVLGVGVAERVEERVGVAVGVGVEPAAATHPPATLVDGWMVARTDSQLSTTA